MAIQEYEYTVTYKPGKIHSNIDQLSKMAHEETCEEDEPLICPKLFELEDNDEAD